MARRFGPLAVTAAAVVSSAAIVAATPALMTGSDEAYTPTKLSTAKYELTALSDITIAGIQDAYFNGYGGYINGVGVGLDRYTETVDVANADGTPLAKYLDPYFGDLINSPVVKTRDADGLPTSYTYNRNYVAISGASGVAYYLIDNALDGGGIVFPDGLYHYFFEYGGLTGNGLGAAVYVASSEVFGTNSPIAQLTKTVVINGVVPTVQAVIVSAAGLLPTQDIGSGFVGGGNLASLYFYGVTNDGDPLHNVDPSYTYSTNGLSAVAAYVTSVLAVPPAAAAASVKAAVTGSANPIQSVIGIFIGNGANAPADCTGSACNGGNAGILFGNGGNGANGGSGGSAGIFFGNGGNGGNGVDASGTTVDNYVAATAGGSGGRGAFLFGNGGDGGNGGADNTDIPGTSVGADGGAGGNAGTISGNGGAGGSGGEASAPTKGSAEGGYGGNGGRGGVFGAGGAGGDGGKAEATSDSTDDYAAGGYGGDGGGAAFGVAGDGGVGGDGVGHDQAAGYAGPGGYGGSAGAGTGGAGGAGGNGSAEDGESAGAYGGDGGNVVAGTAGSGGKGGSSTKPAGSTTGLNAGGDGGWGGRGSLFSRGGNGANGGNATGGGAAPGPGETNPVGGHGGAAGSGGVGGTSGTAGQNGTPDPGDSTAAATKSVSSAAASTSDGSVKKTAGGRHRAH